MEKIFIDHQLFTAFFLKNHPFHTQAVQDVAFFIQTPQKFVTSLHTLNESLHSLRKAVQNSNPSQAEKELDGLINEQLQKLFTKLNIELISSSNANFLKQIKSLQDEYSTSLDVSLTTSLLQEHHIHFIATYDPGFVPLLKAGILTKYPD